MFQNRQIPFAMDNFYNAILNRWNEEKRIYLSENNKMWEKKTNIKSTIYILSNYPLLSDEYQMKLYLSMNVLNTIFKMYYIFFLAKITFFKLLNSKTRSKQALRLTFTYSRNTEILDIRKTAHFYSIRKELWSDFNNLSHIWIIKTKISPWGLEGEMEKQKC